MYVEGDLATLGWAIWRRDPGALAWAAHAEAFADAALVDPKNAHWYRCENTWFAGVDCLPNDAMGRLPQGPELALAAFEGAAVAPLHPAQLSVVYPGYPRPMEGETAAAARYRLTRDAAHVDGVLPVGPDRRRMVKEPHAWILGLPLNAAPDDASPLVVWDGSHSAMRRAFRLMLSGMPPEEAGETDITEVYQTTRRRVFETCKRRPLPAAPGDVILLDRMLLHGIAPWRSQSTTARRMAYFRPETTIEAWLAEA